MTMPALAAISGALPWPEDYAQGWISIENVRIPMPSPQDGLTIAARAGARYASIVQAVRDIKDHIATGAITTVAEIDLRFSTLAPESLI